jgi:hypothetical protein
VRVSITGAIERRVLGETTLTDLHTFHATPSISYSLTVEGAAARVVIIDHGEHGAGDDWVTLTLPEFFKMAHDDALEAFSEALAELLANRPPAPELDVSIDERALEPAA